MARAVGITGTRHGASQRQLDELATLFALLRLPGYGFDTFHDGDCIGADVQGRREAIQHGFIIVVHPSTSRTRAYSWLGTEKLRFDEQREPAPPLVRNKTIVNEVDLMVGLPRYDWEELYRSGTWHALRYAGKVKRKTIIIWPDGRLSTYPQGYRRQE